MTMPKLIGLTGRARSGKDSLASYLRAHHGFHSLAFADPIREGLQAMFGIGDHFAYDAKEVPIPGIGKSYRELAQTLGTEWGRELISPEIWLRVMVLRVERVLSTKSVVITDVRFENEAELIRKNGGIIFHLRRENQPEVREHISENGIEQESNEPVFISANLFDLQHQVESWLFANATDKL